MTLTRSDEMLALAYAENHPEHVKHIKHLFDALMMFVELPEGVEPTYPARREGETVLPSFLKHAHKIVWRAGVPVGLDASPGKSRAFYCRIEYHWKELAQYFLTELSRHHRRFPCGPPVERLSPTQLRVTLTKTKRSEAPTRAQEPPVFNKGDYKPVFRAAMVLRTRDNGEEIA